MSHKNLSVKIKIPKFFRDKLKHKEVNLIYKRFEKSLNINEKSKYFKQYETNKNAIEKLKIAIKNHPMNEKSIFSNNSDNKLDTIANYIQTSKRKFLF